MKTQIQFQQTDGDDGVALIEGPIASLDQAKNELANKLDLPRADDAPATQADIDARLRKGGIDPGSIVFNQIAE